MRVRVGVAALLFSLPAWSMAGWAQLAPSPDAPPVSTAPAPPPEDESVATFKVNANLVDVFFTVKDKQRQPGSPPDQGRLHRDGRQGAAEAEELCG